MNRHQTPNSAVDSNNFANHDKNGDHNSKRQRKWLGNRYLYIMMALVFILFAMIHNEHTTSIRPVMAKDAHPGQFVAEYSRRQLEMISGFGMRSVGSDANEIHVVRYLLDELETIKKQARKVHAMEIDHQFVSGSFTLEFLGEFSSSYDNMQNIVAKFGPATGANDSLLVNCHYDSVVTSPGASDDAVSCALMLEVLRVLSQEHLPLTYNVVFLFNGAEENILQASHGFITQHKWAPQIRAVVNLDSAGSGGKELVFQAGPEHPWLIKSYANVTMHPFASSVGQEIFQSGIIPSDTDYRIFRDFGHIPGIDIAYIYNGYVYHTRFDTADRISDGCMQRGGDNLLSLVRALANAPQLVNPTDEDKHGNMVYWDIMGQALIMYPQRMGTILNSMAVFLVLLDTFGRVMGRGHNHVSGQTYLSGLFKALSALCLSTVSVLLVTGVLALFMTVIGANMTWFHRTEFLTLLYAIPALVTYIITHCTVKQYLFPPTTNFWLVEWIFFEANLLIYTLVLACMTAMGIRSAFLLLLWVALPLFIRIRLPEILNLNFKDHTHMFFAFHVTSVSFPLFAFVYLMYNFYVVFVPLMGRIGPAVNPDLLMGCVTGLAVCIGMSYNAGLIYVIRNIRRTLYTLTVLSVAAYLVALFTHHGFPYSGDLKFPTPQRQVLTAVTNRHYDVRGNVIRDDSHLIFLPMDFNELSRLKSHLPEINNLREHVCSGPYCGVPYMIPFMPVCNKQYLLPIAKWSKSPPCKPLLTKRVKSGTNKEIFYFAVTGPDHMSVYIELEPGTQMTKWSVGNGNPHPTKMVPGYEKDNFFIYYSYGTKPSKPWSFWVEVEAPNAKPDEPSFQIAFSGHYIHGDNRLTPELRSILVRLPEWVHPYAWSSTYQLYQYSLAQ